MNLIRQHTGHFHKKIKAMSICTKQDVSEWE
jgi:hypothetical protein